MNVLGIDVGTSAVKAAVLDIERACQILSRGAATYRIDRPIANAAEVSAETLLAAISQAVTKALGGLEPTVEGIGLSCLTPALCLLGRDNHPLGSFRIHLDRRPRELARRVQADVGPEFMATVGNKPLPGGISAITWLQWQTDNPNLRAQVRRYLHLNSWLVLCLTGETAFDPGNASFTGLWNTLTDRRWSPRWCDYFGVDPGWLPEIMDGQTTIGGLRKEWADRLGLNPGIPVKLGTADTTCGMLAADMQPGELFHSVGTTQVLAALTPRPQPGSNRLTRHFGVGTQFLQVAHNPVGGAALDWIRRLCFSDLSEARFYGQVIDQAAEMAPPTVLDPPFLGGDRLQIDPCPAGFTGLSLDTDRTELLAAILVAMKKHHYEALFELELAGPFRRVVLSGGGCEVVRRLIPDLADRAVVVHDGAVRGAGKLFCLAKD